MTSLGVAVNGLIGQAKAIINGPSLTNGSMFAIAYSDSTTAEQIIMEIGPDASFTTGVRGIRFVSGKVDTYWRNFTYITSPSNYPINAPVAVGATYAGAATSLYVQGALVATGTTTSATTSAVMMNVGGITGQTGYSLRGGVPVAFAWSRVLTPAEMASLSANPWQLFEDEDEDFSFAVATVPINTFSYSGVGGVAFSGVGTAMKNSNRFSLGGFTLSGVTSSIPGTGNRQRVFTASGGVLMSGTTSLSKGATRLATASIQLGGQAVVSRVIEGAMEFLGALGDVIVAKLKWLGGIGARNDILNENQYWRDLAGGSNKPLNDVKKQVLKDQGFIGALNDMEKDYWRD
jgi:hypothetical protein